MTDLMLKTTEMVEDRVVRYAERPITFEEFLRLTGDDDDNELTDGILVRKMAVQLDHENLFAWLFTIMRIYTEKRGLGIVLGSRTAVEINEFNGRLPDILFVRQERMEIVQEKAVYGAPDLVVEIVSPNDRPSDLSGLETDYRSIGVPEIVFIDRRKGYVRQLRKRETGYERTELTAGTLEFGSIEGLTLPVGWLLQEPRPDVYDTLTALFASNHG